MVVVGVEVEVVVVVVVEIGVVVGMILAWWELLLCLMAGACRIGGAAPLPPVIAEGRATYYHAGSVARDARFGCTAEARRLLGSDRFVDHLPTIATRGDYGVWCGDVVLVEVAATGRAAWAWRLDAGPWGCEHADGTRQAIARRGECVERGGVRPSVADLSRGLAEQVGFTGRETIRLRAWREKR